MALKTERIYYQARNDRTGLVDVTANIRRNGVLAAASVALTEVDAVNQPGVYVLTLSPATITSYGGAGFYEFFINSASRNAKAITAKWILANDADDLDADLTTIEGKIDVIDQNVDDVEAALVNPTYGLSALKALIDTLKSSIASVQNNIAFSAGVLNQSIAPGAGTNTYRIPINVFDTSGNMEDPDSNEIFVSIVNEAGVDRSSYLAGFVSGPVLATRDAIGQYRIDYGIPDTAPLETLIFKFEYVEGGLTRVQQRASEVVADVQSSGFALETTAQDILTDTADMQPRVADIQTKVNDATYGLAALKALIDILDTNVDSVKADVENATYGLAALRTTLDTKASQASVTAVDSSLTDAKGAGFATGTDSLKAISDRVYTGGKAI